MSPRSQFDKALEKATSQLLLEPDWDSILQISDYVRQGDVQPKYAIGGIKRKVGMENPHVSMFALQVLESSMKNCGTLVFNEVATKEFMEFMKDQAKNRTDPVKGKVLELIQCWSHAFRNEPNYRVIQDTYNLMKMEGFSFPVLKEADAMFVAEKAPEWKDGEVCTRCRVQFSMVQRKHHCRNCGEIYCGKCSSKASIIPKFGIEKEVRVCEACYEKLNKGGAAGAKKPGSSEDDLPAEYLASPLSKQSQNPPGKSEQEIKEEEDLQLALALSKSEHENKEKERDRGRSNRGYGSGGTDQSATANNRNPGYTQPQLQTVAAPVIDTTDMDPELARYLNRNYWQQRSEDIKTTNVVSVPNSVSTTTPSAPVVSSEPRFTAPKVVEVYQNGETDDDQTQFLNALNSSIEIFVNRMKSNSQRGRSIANDSSVQSLFSVISTMHPQLMNSLQEQEDLRTHYESLQDKLAQLRDAREALNALREDHAEKKRLEREELERQRQIQMALKLDIMRQKKHEYLEMQRQLHLQRLQEQEREMLMRIEQQKQLTQIRQMQTYGYPQMMYQPGMPGQSPVGSVEGSPVHLQQQQQPPPGGYMPPVGQSMPPVGQSMPPQSMPGYGVAPGQQQPVYSQSQQQYQNQAPNMVPPNMTPGNYQPPPDGVMPPGGVPYQSMSYSQANPQGNPGIPNQPQMAPPPQGYQQGANTQDYQPYNMQSMSNALPNGQNPPAYTPAPQQYMGASQQPPPQAQYQQAMGQIPPNQPPPQQQQQQQQQIAQPNQQPQGNQQLLEAQLICFD